MNAILRRASLADAASIASCVCEAYLPYIERLGRQPDAMLRNYMSIVGKGATYVAILESRAAGVLILRQSRISVTVEEMAVRPSLRGIGLEDALLSLAERKALEIGAGSVVLSVHAMLHELRDHYARLGYVEFGRRSIRGAPHLLLGRHVKADRKRNGPAA